MTQEHNGQTLAYLGDAVLELLFREHWLLKGRYKIAELHDAVVECTSARGQNRLLALIEPHLSACEHAIVKRGRNAPLSRKTRRESLTVQRRASALETLFGHLYMSNETRRIQELFDVMMTDIQDAGLPTARISQDANR